MHVADHRLMRDFRRVNVALNFMKHDVRSSVIAEWTGFSEKRLNRMRKRTAESDPDEPTARRGRVLRDVRVFFRTAAMRDEATMVATILYETQVIPDERSPAIARSLPSVARAERLLRAYEGYQNLFEAPAFSLEQVVFLARTLAAGERLIIDACAICHGALLVELQHLRRNRCVSCTGDGMTPKLATPECVSLTDDTIQPGAQNPRQASLF